MCYLRQNINHFCFADFIYVLSTLFRFSGNTFTFLLVSFLLQTLCLKLKHSHTVPNFHFSQTAEKPNHKSASGRNQPKFCALTPSKSL